jgi:threonine/homoserine/homoserine lactone efflux protein
VRAGHPQEVEVTQSPAGDQRTTKEKIMDNGPLLALSILVLCFIYVIPGIVASNRNHRQATAIWAVDLLFGWTLIGWGVALVWALTNPREPI